MKAEIEQMNQKRYAADALNAAGFSGLSMALLPGRRGDDFS